MSNYRVSLSFVQLSDGALGDFTDGVLVGLNSNPKFPAPPAAVGALTDALATFSEAIGNAALGGKPATAIKNNARAALIALLRKDASYVQTVAGTDLAGLLSSGFLAVSTNRSSVPLPKPVIDNVDNFQTTKLMLGVKRDRNARAYEVRHKSGANGYVNGGVFTKARRMVVEDLTPGTVYELQTRAVGGSVGYSDWSDPVSHMAT